MKIGDKVIYQDVEYVIEKDYGNDVYFIGNKDAFCDMIPRHLMTLILECFEGFVDKFDGETAYVTLKSQNGEVFWGKYPVKELESKGIHERRRFKCKTISRGDYVSVEMEAIPDREISAEEERDITDKICKLLGNND